MRPVYRLRSIIVIRYLNPLTKTEPSAEFERLSTYRSTRSDYEFLMAGVSGHGVFANGSSLALTTLRVGSRTIAMPSEVTMFLVLFFVFLVCWVFGFVVFHVAGGLIHALLIVAAISLIWHFVSGRTRV
jgi:hypothetical protein